MKQKFKNVMPVIAITTILLLVLEFVSMAILKNDGLPYLLNVNFKSMQIEKLSGYGFNEIHPLLGWRMSNSLMESSGYTLEKNTIVLQAENKQCAEPIKIYITGGSTSDIALHKDNWPIHLKKILDDNNVCYKIYVAAVGGYNSGQEFLKLILDLDNEIEIDLHISYSGANEFQHPSFVSEYEKDLFKQVVTDQQAKFFPNTLKLIRKTFNRHGATELSPLTMMDSPSFWLSNMHKMKAISEYNGYQFHGVLQPVITFSGLNSKMSNSLRGVNNYEHFGYSGFYPAASKSCSSNDFLYDFTDLFENNIENVFIDDCHLKEEYQHIVAERIFDKILKELDSPNTQF